jgi:hypothetical protein
MTPERENARLETFAGVSERFSCYSQIGQFTRAIRGCRMSPFRSVTRKTG